MIRPFKWYWVFLRVAGLAQFLVLLMGRMVINHDKPWGWGSPILRQIRMSWHCKSYEPLGHNQSSCPNCHTISCSNESKPLQILTLLTESKKKKATRLGPYCGWKKSCTTLDGWTPINSGTNHRFQLVQDFATIHCIREKTHQSPRKSWKGAGTHCTNFCPPKHCTSETDPSLRRGSNS